MILVFLVLELVGLWLGTEILIRRTLSFSERFGLSQTFIGLTAVSIGTDLPEFLISATASIQTLNGADASGMIVGNAIGSCFAQISVVLGLATLAGALKADRQTLKYGGIPLLGGIIVVFLLAFDGRLTRLEGVFMIIVYMFFLRFQSKREQLVPKVILTKNPGLLTETLYLLGGLGIVIVMSNLAVTSALTLAEQWGVKQSFVGIVILGLGTSLPELAISLNAARKKAIGLSVGNLIGSNIFDLLIPMGFGAMIVPIGIERDIRLFDVPFLFILTMLVFYFFRKERKMAKLEAGILVAIYLLYVFTKM